MSWIHLIHEMGSRATVTISGVQMRAVLCEQCNQWYGYGVQAQATGRGRTFVVPDDKAAIKRAKYSARTELNAALNRRRPAVPCPRCGYFQSSMHWRAKWEHSAWLFLIALLPLFFGWTFVMPVLHSTERNSGTRILDDLLSFSPHLFADPHFALFACFVLPGPLLMLVWALRFARFQPNAGDPPQRIRQYSKIAVPLLIIKGEDGNDTLMSERELAERAQQQAAQAAESARKAARQASIDEAIRQRPNWP